MLPHHLATVGGGGCTSKNKMKYVSRVKKRSVIYRL